MRGRWLRLGLLWVLPWLTGCVSGPRIQQGARGLGAQTASMPSAHPIPVELSQEAFALGLTSLLLQMPLKVDGARWEDQIQPVSWTEGVLEDTAQRSMERQCLSSELKDGCLTLPAGAPPPEALARMRLALSFAMDTVWDGAAVPVGEYLDPLAFKIMVCTAMSTYLLLLMIPVPEPVTKGMAATLTLYLVAYLGVGPVWSLVKAGGRLLRESREANTIEHLEKAGHRFGEVLGDSGMRVLLLLATAALSGQGRFLNKGPGLPGFGQATLNSQLRTRVALGAAGQVRTVTLGSKEITVVLAPTTVAATALGPGGGAPPEESAFEKEPKRDTGSATASATHVEPAGTGRWHEGSYGSPMNSLQDHFARHGAEVGATDAAQYLRKAEAFAQNLRGARKLPIEGSTRGVVRYIKNGRYIDLASDGRIVSFGAR